MSLNKLVKRGYKSKFLYVADNSTSYLNSGIRATLFGATGCLGSGVGHRLGSIGSDVIMPTRNRKHYDDFVKMLRADVNLGMGYVMYNMDFNDPNAIARSMAKSNVVVNLIGPSRRLRKQKDFEEVNIDIPQKLAREARKRGIKKFIHFSALGVDPKSTSLDLMTKYHGELAVRDEFPDAVILRPGTVVGWDDYSQRLIRKQVEHTFNFMMVYGDLQAKRQPITDDDVAEAVMNAIKLNEANGQTFELGGPFVYTRMEIYETMFNILKRPVDLIKISPQLAMGVTRVFNSMYFNHDDFMKDSIDLVVNKREGVKTIEDLYVRPVSVVNKLEHINFNYGSYIDLTPEQKQWFK